MVMECAVNTYYINHVGRKSIIEVLMKGARLFSSCTIDLDKLVMITLYKVDVISL